VKEVYREKSNRHNGSPGEKYKYEGRVEVVRDAIARDEVLAVDVSRIYGAILRVADLQALKYDDLVAMVRNVTSFGIGEQCFQAMTHWLLLLPFPEFSSSKGRVSESEVNSK